MAFTNAITGGQGALLRTAIKSPNFLTGVRGWSINKDGTAEFVQLIIISGDGSGNTVKIENGSLVFRNAANVITTEIRATGEIISHNLTTTSGASAEIFEGALNFPPNVAYAWHTEDPNITGLYNPDPPTHATSPALRLTSGSDQAPSPGWESAVLELVGPSDDGLTPASIQSFNNGVAAFLEWVHDGDFTATKSLAAFGRDVGSGTTGFVARQTNAVAAAVETIALTLGGLTFATGRAYKLTVKGLVTSTIANDRAQVRLRRTNLAGTVYIDSMSSFVIPAINANVAFDLSVIATNTTGADITGATLVLSYARNAGTGNINFTADASNPGYIRVEDVGLAASFTLARAIV